MANSVKFNGVFTRHICIELNNQVHLFTMNKKLDKTLYLLGLNADQNTTPNS